MTGGTEERELEALHDAGAVLGLATAAASLVSSTSRIIWHLPGPAAAVLISRSGTKGLDEVDAEANAVRAASDNGVRTPRLLAGPIELENRRVALAYEWIEGRPAAEADWPGVGRELATLARGTGAGLTVLRWPSDLPESHWTGVLGADLGKRFSQHCRHAQASIDAMTSDRSKLVLCHGDVQPANVIVDADGAPWLIDFEYACLAPREWDPAKLVILNRRFGDPHDLPGVLASWPALDRTRLAVCVRVQEALLVAWLVRMALNQTLGALAEARRRARSLDEGSQRWRHLR